MRRGEFGPAPPATDEAIDFVLRELALHGRKARVAAGLIRGQTLKEIAHELEISTSTVKTFCSRLYAGVGVFDRLEFCAVAFKILANRSGLRR